MSSKKNKKLNFDEALQQLETLVKQLEESDTGVKLEEAMKLFEKGSKLVKQCREILADAEQRVEELTPTEPKGE